MAVRTQTRVSPTNLLLTALPPREYKRLAPHLELVSFAAKHALYPPSKAITHVYFPENAVIPIVLCLKDGRTTEVGMVGNEGFVGIHALFGDSVIPYHCFTLIGGNAYRIPADRLLVEFKRGGMLQDILLGYTQARLSQFAQISACNCLHPLDKRVCRWLLMVHDRSMLDELSLTQEDIARVLGVRRTGVTEAVGSLQQKKLISYRYGRITIRNRKRLERATCECYGIINSGFNHLPG